MVLLQSSKSLLSEEFCSRIRIYFFLGALPLKRSRLGDPVATSASGGGLSLLAFFICQLKLNANKKELKQTAPSLALHSGNRLPTFRTCRLNRPLDDCPPPDRRVKITYGRLFYLLQIIRIPAVNHVLTSASKFRKA